MNARVGGETGFRCSGILNLCESEAEMEVQRARIADLGDLAQRLGMRLLSAQQAGEAAPGSTIRWAGGVICDSDGRAEPGLAAPAIAAGAARAGAAILTGCAVRGFDYTAGKVSAAVTERGVISCDQVVIAGGVWSRHLCGSLGIRLPQLMVMESLLRTTPPEGPSGPCLTIGTIAHRPRLDGGYTVAHEFATVADILPASFRYMGDFLPALRQMRARVGLRLGRKFLDELALPRRWALDGPSPFETTRRLAATPRRKKTLEAFALLQAQFPQFRGTRVAQHWAGFIDVTPDALPVLPEVPGHAGLFFATGFSGHGFGLGPGVGTLVADLVTGASPSVDLAPFCYDRFLGHQR